MYIEKITIKGFRCFGSNATAIDLDVLTGFVGANGCGKSAVLQALAKLFGISSSERAINPSDFYVAPGTQIDDESARQLSIEAKLGFPELAGGQRSSSIPECFQQMVIDAEGAAPYCRIRLEANWTRTNTPGGEIESGLYWVTSPETESPNEEKRAVGRAERARIHLHYVPAARDPSLQLRQTSGTVTHRLLRAVEWSEHIRSEVNSAGQAVRRAFQEETGLGVIQRALAAAWGELFDGDFHKCVTINPTGRRFEEILARVEASFSPTPDGPEDSTERLSEGLKSLFYLSLVKTVLDVEQAVLDAQEDDDVGISREALDPPSLTILAVEEPENHLAPHYLGRIMQQCRGIVDNGRAQVLLASHSPSILARLEPEEVRHLRLDTGRTTVVMSILLPAEADEAHKYVREAVRAYPELYFSRLVILGEGDSEQVVIPRIARALGVKLDESFVSVVPLGGRHVNHFWRLLGQLGIPFITLLDYDRRRGGGGWGRVKYVLEQLLLNGAKRDELLNLGDGEVLSEGDFAGMAGWPLDADDEKGWISFLESQRVFFCHPYDIDWMMFKAFPDAYKSLAPAGGGPRVPEKDGPKYQERLAEAVAAVRKVEVADVGDVSRLGDPETYFWYRYLFLGRGKPVSHIQALAGLADEDVAKSCPAVLERLVGAAAMMILGQHGAGVTR